MLNSWGGLLNQNVFLSAEMNMLKMLNVLGGARRWAPGERNSTYSTFQLKEISFLLLSAEMLNMLNSGGPVESKCACFS